MHLFVLCLKPEKYLCRPMQTTNTFISKTVDGVELSIPTSASCYVPDLFSGDSFCLIDIMCSDIPAPPRKIIFVNVDHVDHSTSPWTLVFNEQCHVMDLNASSTTSKENTVPTHQHLAYRVPTKLREAGVTVFDVESVEQIIDHNLTTYAVAWQVFTYIDSIITHITNVDLGFITG